MSVWFGLVEPGSLEDPSKQGGGHPQPQAPGGSPAEGVA